MTGRPFRIAAAGLAMAFVWSALTTLSHVRTGGDDLVLHRRPQPATELIARTPPPRPELTRGPADVPTKVSPSAVSPPAVLLQAPEPLPQVAQAEPAPSESTSALPVEMLPIVLGPAIEEPAEIASPSPAFVTASNTRRRKEFIALPAPPEFDEDSDHELQTPLRVTAAVPVQTASRREPDPVLLAELTSLRRDFDRLVDQQQMQRAQDAERARLETLERQTQQTLADLRHSVEELRLEQQELRLPPETPSASAPAAPPVSLSPVEPEGPSRTLPENLPEASDIPLPPRHPIAISESTTRGSYDFEIDGAPLHAVLAAIGELGRWNIVASPEVQGTVTAVWRSVTPQQALDAVLRAHGLATRQQSSFLMVSTSRQSEATTNAPRTTVVKLFRPHYVSGRDLLPLIQPLLTPQVGQVGVTLPQTSAEAQLVTGGGDSLAQPDAVLVVDYPEVLENVRQTIAVMDVPAPHVELEATILDVQLAGRVQNGVARVLKAGELCADSACMPLELHAGRSDICCQTSPESCAQIVERLRACSDVRVVSTARLHVLNKQPAQLCVGESFHWRMSPVRKLSGGETAAVTEDATRLFVRPFVAADDLVRLEVAPESTVALPLKKGAARQAFAGVSTNVAIPSGGSLVIAGLNVEQTLPAKPALFKPWERLRGKGRAQTVEQRELVIVISPRVIRTSPAEMTAEPGVSDGLPGGL